MMPQITVAIVSWLLEDRLIKTLIDIPKTTSLPLNLCLHVQGEEQISDNVKQDIINAASDFIEKDIYFTEGNIGIAPPRAEQFRRINKTPFIFISDNDMDYAKNTIDREFEFLTNPKNSTYGMVDVVFNELLYHRRVKGTKVICTPVNYNTSPHIVDIDLTGGTSILIRTKVASIPKIIDTRYCIGSWDFDMSMNVRKAGWKIATIVDKDLIANNDHSSRTENYIKDKTKNPIIQQGRELFESKWGFSCMYFPRNRIVPKHRWPDTTIITRAIYNNLGILPKIGVLDLGRISLMQRNFINCLKNQIDQNFKVCVVTGAEGNIATKKIQSLDWGDLNVEFIYTSGDTSEWEKSVSVSKCWGREADLGSPENIVKNLDLPKTSIMARLDNDDWVVPGWVSHMKYLADNTPTSHFLINYQVIGQAPDGRLYKFYAPHVKARTSPFIVLVQKEEPRINLYANFHLRMGSLFSNVITIPPSYVYMVVHGGNRSNTIYEHDEFIEPIETQKNQDNKIIQLKQGRVNKQFIRGTNWRTRIANASVASFNK